MFAEWYKPGCLLEYPEGGSGAIIDALVRGIHKFGGRLALRAHVDKILIENGRAVGVKLQSGQVSFRRYFKQIRQNATPQSFFNYKGNRKMSALSCHKLNSSKQVEKP
jgi:phytoene dehydrogenase-like protein